MIEQRSKVIGTLREPDGDPAGRIVGLVLAAQDDPRPFLWLEAAIAWAEKRLLWCSASDGGSPVEIEPRDLDGDGLSDHVATHPDPTARNNLRQLNIWADGPKVWLTFRGEIVGGAAKFQDAAMGDAELGRFLNERLRRR